MNYFVNDRILYHTFDFSLFNFFLMCSHVFSKIAIWGKALLTEAALERSLTSVLPLMNYQVYFWIVSFNTPLVRALVPWSSGWFRPTSWLSWWIWSMGVLTMGFQMAFQLELVVALIASERSWSKLFRNIYHKCRLTWLFRWVVTFESLLNSLPQ